MVERVGVSEVTSEEEARAARATRAVMAVEAKAVEKAVVVAEMAKARDMGKVVVTLKGNTIRDVFAPIRNMVCTLHVL